MNDNSTMNLINRIGISVPYRSERLSNVLTAIFFVGFSEFVRSGLYAAYLPQAIGTLTGLDGSDAITVSSTAFVIHFFSDTVMRAPAGNLITRYQNNLPVICGALLSFIASLLLWNAHSATYIFILSCMHGIGFSFVWPFSLNLAASSSKESHMGRGVTLFTLAIMPFIGIGTFGLGALVNYTHNIAPFIISCTLGLALMLSCFLPNYAKAKENTRNHGYDRGIMKSVAVLLPAAFLQTSTMSLIGPLIFSIYRDLNISYIEFVKIVAAGALTALLSFVFTGKMADSGNARISVTLGFAILAIGMAGLSSSSAVWILYTMAMLVGVGYALIMPGWAALVNERLPEDKRPAAWGVLMTAENMGIWTGPLVGAFAYRSLGTTGPFLVVALLASLASLGYIAFRKRIR